MSCSSIDLKAYALGELDERATREAATHVHACAECGEELERLKLTHMALLSLRDEEPPRRIAFVSDKVFEPKWWQRMWQSAPVMAFASAAMLSCAILVHAYTRPAPVTVVHGPAVDSAAIEQRVEARVSQRLSAAVAQAVAEVKTADEQKMTTVLAASNREYQLQRRADLAALRDDLELAHKINSRLFMASANIEEHP